MDELEAAQSRPTRSSIAEEFLISMRQNAQKGRGVSERPSQPIKNMVSSSV